MRYTVTLMWVATLTFVACAHDWAPVTRDGGADTIAQYDATGDATAGLPCTACPGGCFVLGNDPSNCGSCGNVCVPPAEATATCTAGVCDFACATGFDRCGNRCFQTDMNASFCGQACVDCGALPHVLMDTVGCDHGVCSLLNACVANWGDCDGLSSSGCETDLSSVNHCGSCSQHCGGATSRCTADPVSGGYVCSI